jgi:hypothetical protein
MRKENSFGDSPREMKQGGNGSSSNLRAAGNDPFFDFQNNPSLVGIYEDGKHSPEISRINHFLPDSIKGASNS